VHCTAELTTTHHYLQLKKRLTGITSQGALGHVPAPLPLSLLLLIPLPLLPLLLLPLPELAVTHVHHLATSV